MSDLIYGWTEEDFMDSEQADFGNLSANQTKFRDECVKIIQIMNQLSKFVKEAEFEFPEEYEAIFHNDFWDLFE